MPGTLNGHAPRFNIRESKRQLERMLTQTDSKTLATLSLDDDRLVLSFNGHDTPAFLKDILAAFNGSKAPNIVSSRGGRLKVGASLGLEAVAGENADALRNAEKKLDEILAGPQPNLLKNLSEQGEHEGFMDMTVRIPKDGPGILYAILKILWEAKVAVVSLESESFGDGTANIKARLHLPKNCDLDAITAEILTESPGDANKWTVSYDPLPKTEAIRRDTNELN